MKRALTLFLSTVVLSAAVPLSVLANSNPIPVGIGYFQSNILSSTPGRLSPSGLDTFGYKSVFFPQAKTNQKNLHIPFGSWGLAQFARDVSANNYNNLNEGWAPTKLLGAMNTGPLEVFHTGDAIDETCTTTDCDEYKSNALYIVMPTKQLKPGPVEVGDSGSFSSDLKRQFTRKLNTSHIPAQLQDNTPLHGGSATTYRSSGLRLRLLLDKAETIGGIEVPTTKAPKLYSWSDFSATMSLENGYKIHEGSADTGGTLYYTVTEGSPFVYFMYKQDASFQLDQYIKIGSLGDFSVNGESVDKSGIVFYKTVTQDGQQINVYLRYGGHQIMAIFVDQSQLIPTFDDGDNLNFIINNKVPRQIYFVVAALPFRPFFSTNEKKNAKISNNKWAGLDEEKAQPLTTKEKTYIDNMASLAFNYIVDTRVTYSKSQGGAANVSSTFNITTNDVLKNSDGGVVNRELKHTKAPTSDDTLFTLYPHQYLDGFTNNGKRQNSNLIFTLGGQVSTPTLCLSQQVSDGASTNCVVGYDQASNDNSTRWSSRYDDWSANDYWPYNKIIQSGGVNKPVFYYSLLGPMLAAKGTHFTVTYPVQGVLPFLPSANKFSTKNDTKALFNRFYKRFQESSKNRGLVYHDIKRLSAAAQALATGYEFYLDGGQIDKADLTGLYQSINSQLGDYFKNQNKSLWSDNTSSLGSRYFVYNKNRNVLYAEPSSLEPKYLKSLDIIGGHFVGVANALGAGWNSFLQYGQDVDQIIYSYDDPYEQDSYPDSYDGNISTSSPANDNWAISSGKSPVFAYFESYDPYLGFSSSAGISGRVSQHSIAEDIAGFANIALHAAAMRGSAPSTKGFDKLETTALAQYAIAQNAYALYWQDRFHYYDSWDYSSADKSVRNNFVSKIATKLTSITGEYPGGYQADTQSLTEMPSQWTNEKQDRLIFGNYQYPNDDVQILNDDQHNYSSALPNEPGDYANIVGPGYVSQSAFSPLSSKAYNIFSEKNASPSEAAIFYRYRTDPLYQRQRALFPLSPSSFYLTQFSQQLQLAYLTMFSNRVKYYLTEGGDHNHYLYFAKPYINSENYGEGQNQVSPNHNPSPAFWDYYEAPESLFSDVIESMFAPNNGQDDFSYAEKAMMDYHKYQSQQDKSGSQKTVFSQLNLSSTATNKPTIFYDASVNNHPINPKNNENNYYVINTPLLIISLSVDPSDLYTPGLIKRDALPLPSIDAWKNGQGELKLFESHSSIADDSKPTGLIDGVGQGYVNYYHFIQVMKNYGRQDPDIVADTPYAIAFTMENVTHKNRYFRKLYVPNDDLYVVYNPTSTTENVNFYNSGTKIFNNGATVPPKTMLVFSNAYGVHLLDTVPALSNLSLDMPIADWTPEIDIKPIKGGGFTYQWSPIKDKKDNTLTANYFISINHGNYAELQNVSGEKVTWNNQGDIATNISLLAQYTDKNHTVWTKTYKTNKPMDVVNWGQVKITWTGPSTATLTWGKTTDSQKKGLQYDVKIDNGTVKSVNSAQESAELTDLNSGGHRAITITASFQNSADSKQYSLLNATFVKKFIIFYNALHSNYIKSLGVEEDLTGKIQKFNIKFDASNKDFQSEFNKMDLIYYSITCSADTQNNWTSVEKTSVKNYTISIPSAKVPSSCGGKYKLNLAWTRSADAEGSRFEGQLSEPKKVSIDFLSLKKELKAGQSTASSIVLHADELAHLVHHTDTKDVVYNFRYKLSSVKNWPESGWKEIKPSSNDFVINGLKSGQPYDIQYYMSYASDGVIPINQIVPSALGEVNDVETKAVAYTIEWDKTFTAMFKKSDKNGGLISVNIPSDATVNIANPSEKTENPAFKYSFDGCKTSSEFKDPNANIGKAGTYSFTVNPTSTVYPVTICATYPNTTAVFGKAQNITVPDFVYFDKGSTVTVSSATSTSENLIWSAAKHTGPTKQSLDYIIQAYQKNQPVGQPIDTNADTTNGSIGNLQPGMLYNVNVRAENKGSPGGVVKSSTSIISSPFLTLLSKQGFQARIVSSDKVKDKVKIAFRQADEKNASYTITLEGCDNSLHPISGLSWTTTIPSSIQSHSGDYLTPELSVDRIQLSKAAKFQIIITESVSDQPQGLNNDEEISQLTVMEAGPLSQLNGVTHSSTPSGKHHRSFFAWLIHLIEGIF